MENELTNRLTNLPAELSGFGDYNAAVVAFRYTRRSAGQVPLDRWIEAAKWAAERVGSLTSGSPDPQVTMMDVLDRVGLTKSPSKKPAL